MQPPPLSPSLAMATPIPYLWTILSESKRIINTHRRHFLTLSLIFFLPVSFSSLLFPILFQISNTNPHPPSTPTHQPINPNITLLLFSLVYSLFVLVFSFCAVSSITYSVFHSFYGQPIKLVSAIKSIFSSFLPLLSTAIVSLVIILFISFQFGFLLFLVIFGFELLGISISYSSPYFLGFFLVLALLFVMVYLQVRWSLVSAIVVLESRWGLDPLRRSASLIKGMKGVAVSSLFFFWFFEGILVWCSSLFTKGSYGITSDWVSVVQILLIIAVNSVFLTMLQLYNTAANTMLYIYCKAIHNEEFGSDCVSLPFDDRKVPPVASVIHV